MSEMVERVMEAIASELRDSGGPIPIEYRDAARAAIAAVEASGHRIVKDVSSDEALRHGFDQRSYEVGYMEGENNARADQLEPT